MTIVCAWCRKLMGIKPPYVKLETIHGICPECKRHCLGRPLQATRQAMKNTVRRME